MKGKNNSKEVLKQKIREVLNQNSEGVSDLSNKGIDELVAEVSIYHQELEYQNEELMRIRDELEITKEHFKSLYNDAPIGYTLCSEDLTIQSANTKFCDLISCKERTILKKKLTDYIQPESQDDFYFHIKDLIKSKTPKENEIKLLSGTDEITVKLVSNTFTEEGNRFIRIAVFDISKEKKLEAETLKSRQKLKSYIDTSPTPIFIANAEGKYTYVNHAACELFGYKYEELTELSITDLAKEVTKEFLQAWDEVRTFGYVKGVELVLKSKSDDPVYVLLDSVKVSDDEFIAFVVDITHRKFEEEKYRSIISSSIDGFCILDEKGNFIEANEAYAKMIGYSSSELTSGMGLIDIEANEDSKDIARHINKIIEQGTDQFITKQRSKSGKVIDIEISTAYIPSQNHFVVFVRDVTEQQKSKDLLIQNERLLTQAQHTANMGHYNLSFITGEWSSSAGLDNIFEIGPSYKKSVEGWLQLVHPDHLEEMQKHLNEDVIKNKKPFNRQYKIIGQETGKIKWVHGKGELIFSEDGNPQKMSGIIQDITNQKLVEEELRENNLRFALAVESAGIAVWDWDVENNILRWDDKMHELYEVDKDNFEGAYATWISALHEDDKERINNEINLAIENKKDYNTEFRIRVKNGKVKYLRAFAKTLRDESGKATKMIGVNYEITELKKAQQELIASEQRFRLIFDNIHSIAVQGYNADGIVHYWNKASENLYGYSQSEAVGKKLYDLIIPDFMINDVKEAVQNMFKTEGPIPPEELRLKKKDGSLVPVYSNHTIVNLIGKQKELFCIDIDLTERKKAESELKFQANLLKEIGESVIATDSEGLIIYWNQAAEVLYGWKEEEVIGNSIIEITPSNQSLETAEKVMNELIAGKRWSGEMQHKKKNGETFDAYVTDSPFFDENENLVGIIGVSKDISELKKVEKDLRSRNEFIQTVLDNLPIGIALNKINDGRAQYMNKKFEEIYGWPEEEMKEIPEFFERIYPDVEYREQIVAKIVSDINSRDPRKMYWENIEIRTKENEVKKVNAQNIPLFEQNTMVSTVLDVTAVKNAEKILVESQRLSAIGEMSSAIAHDFNNSLQSILGNLDLSLIQLNENHPSRRYLETIKNATTDAAARVRALQRFAGKSKSKGSYSELNVNQMIEDVIQQSRPLWKDSREKDGIQFKIVTDLKEVKSVLGNEGELKSVLYNAIKNSVEAMPKGGNITINTYQKNKNVGILITDEGKGMDEKTKARIFQPFFSTKGFESGRGLGMSGAYSILKEHNGNIYIKSSSPNKGTSLAIELPAIIDKEKIEISENVSKKYEGKANILWVDDDKMIREVAQEMISVIGHKGKVVGSGKEALEELEKEEYDLLVTDIGMPGMSGWELIEKIKKTNDSKLKIAVLTGWGDQIGDEEKNKHKISHVISKPFKIDQLSSIIGSILSEE